MQPTHVIISRNRPVSGGNGRSSSSFTSLVCQIFTAIVSFALGTMTCLLASNNTMCPPNVPNAVLSALSGWQLPSSSTNQNINDIIDENRRLHDRIRNMEDNQQSEIDRLVTIKVEREVTKQCGNVRVLENEAEHEEAAEDSVTLFPMESVGRFAVAMARTSKQDFADALEMGIPLDPPTAGSDEVLLLYSRSTAIPASFGDDYDKIPHIDMPDAISKCEYLNIVLTDNTGRRNQCVALVPQYESYHIQKWMRLNEDDMIDADSPLRMVSRGQTNGRDLFDPPDLREDTREFWKIMSLYLENIDVVLKELRPILRRIAIDKTVIVMVCNFGQAQLLINFVCAAKSRNLDISNIIVFTTDQETTDIATSLGLAAYYDQRNYGDIPMGAAQRYGDNRFTAMMMAKVICVQMVSMLGYDFLFQDVDIIWYKNPLEYFNKLKAETTYDLFFQDDGGHSVRYAPYAANSGFYYARHNARTRHFFNTLFMTGDLIVSTHSHQQALIATLNEHVSLFGLKVKVLARTEEEFPGGFHFHQRSKDYMKKFFKGEHKPYIFHMSWTLNKDNKLAFFRQMGEWYVQDKCIDKNTTDIFADEAMTTTRDLVSSCCAAEPLFSCHYRDKPSIKPCKHSPPIDKGRRSWW